MKTNEVLETIKTRRSVRAYTAQAPETDDLVTILEAAKYAPNGMHLESWHFTAIQNAEKLEELNSRIKGAFAKSDDKHLQERGHNKAYCCYYHAPVLAAHSLGIGSCWINQLGTTCNDPEVREFITSLGVPADHQVYGCVALGYADPKAPLKEKVVKEGTVTIVE